MLKRLLLGLLKGSLIGAGVGSLLVFVFGVSTMGSGLAYLAVVLTGILVALLAGKPIWARGAWVEVLLKGVAAALVGAALLYGVRNYLDTTVAFGPSMTGSLSQLPLAILPLVATVLAVFFEVDNTDEPELGDSDKGQRVRVDAPPPDRAATEVDLEGEGKTDEAKHVARN